MQRGRSVLNDMRRQSKPRGVVVEFGRFFEGRCGRAEALAVVPEVVVRCSVVCGGGNRSLESWSGESAGRGRGSSGMFWAVAETC
jgi:hypothetical protein